MSANWLERVLSKAHGEPGFFRYPNGRRYLVVDGKPPRESVLEKAVRNPETARIQIRSLADPSDADLAWLRPVLGQIRDVDILWPEGRVDLSILAEAPNLEFLGAEVAVKGSVDFSTFRGALRELSIIKGRRGNFKGISRLQHLERLAVDAPGPDVRFLSDLPNLNTVVLTAARQVSELPAMGSLQKVRKITIHGSRELDLNTLSTYASSLGELDLDSVKAITNGESVRNCIHLEKVDIEECGPRLNGSDLRYLMLNGKLRHLWVIGRRLPIVDSEMHSLLADSEMRDLLVTEASAFDLRLPPRFMN